MESPPPTPDAFLNKLSIDAGQIEIALALPLQVLIGSWNVGNKMPPTSVDPWLPQGGGGFDVIAVGLQESSFKKSSSSSNDVFDEDDDDEENGEVVEVTEVSPPKQLQKSPSNASKRNLNSHYPFYQQLEEHFGQDYVIAGHVDLMEIRLIVFVHNRHEFTDVEKITEATGVGNVIGNKGGTVLKLVVDGISLCFVNCHLAAHESQKFLDRRNSDCAEILNGARVGRKSLSLDHQFDHVFWFGDMNYRVNLAYSNGSNEEMTKEAHWEAVHALVEQEGYATLYANDQLQHQLDQQKALAGWTTVPCNFPPTFKRIRGQQHEFTKQRVPSYCDRILWKSLPGYAKNLKLLKYECVEAICTSDHKPILGAFEIARYTPGPKTALRNHQSLEVQFTEMSATNLLAMDLTGQSDPYIKFYCTIPNLLLEDEAGKKHPQSGIVKANVNPVWTDDQIPTLKIKARLNELGKVHLVLVLMDYDAASSDDALGQVVLCMEEFYAEDGGGVAFERPVVQNGVPSGTLRGKITITPSDKGLAGWEKTTNAVPGCTCNVM
ncbi:phosphatidylinositol-3,4,5-trisphosphate 5-phosphatase [Thraustotheca clavata]|uniref:Phosphatidylinositol-3,4,5-trisphosphate 5-phosphatase n=1 Tax=Thraustotheca clavata TaxID=74557 RepID=A0A1V9ZWR6_9STRA|nr:phosphatidylinositol-3,4,5-trisphosphate 5-phosphatase [Thraustotheca clavata]